MNVKVSKAATCLAIIKLFLPAHKGSWVFHMKIVIVVYFKEVALAVG